MKRFTETTKWDDPWFIRLPALQKLLWLYLCDRCDASGVIDFCSELAAVQIGAGTLTEESLEAFGNRVLHLPSGKWQIVKFLPFQYGTVDAHCPAHKPVIRLISSNGLQYPINNLSNRVLDTPKEKNKDKSTEKEEGECEGKPKLVPSPEDIYNAYPLKKERPQALIAIRNAIKTHGAEFLLERTMAYAKARNGDVSYVPYPQKWFNREGFKDDPETWQPSDNGNPTKPKKPWDTMPKPKPQFGELYGT